MAAASEPDNTPLPGTVFTPRQVRVLKIAVIVMGLLLVGGFAFVLAAIVYQASRGGQATPSAEAAPALNSFRAPNSQGCERHHACSRWRPARSPSATRLQGGEIVVIDVATGKVLARIRLKPAISLDPVRRAKL